MKRVLFVILSGLVLLSAVLLIRTLRFTTRQFQANAPIQAALNRDQIAAHLSGAIRFKTISFLDAKQFDHEEFLGLHQYLEQTFPVVHQTLTKEAVGDFSLLYTWAGDEPAEKPILLYAHMDVVPVEAAREGDWTYPPFEGRIAEGYIWGRDARFISPSAMMRRQGGKGVLPRLPHVCIPGESNSSTYSTKVSSSRTVSCRVFPGQLLWSASPRKARSVSNLV